MGRFEAYGVEAKTIIHFHARSPQILTTKVRGFFKGTRMILVPVGAGKMRVQDPYGRQIPNFMVLRTDRPLRYWFQEIQWTKKGI